MRIICFTIILRHRCGAELCYRRIYRKWNIISYNPGFEIYCTEDGVNYETITLDGFNDEYNYGCRTFLVGSDGLYIGTANPFYGGQLWKLNERTVGVEKFVSNIESLNEAFDEAVTSYEAEVPFETEVFDFTFVPADHGNTVYVNGTAIEGWDSVVDLEVGVNTVTVVNEDIDGIERAEYTFKITRLEAETPDDGGNGGEGSGGEGSGGNGGNDPVGPGEGTNGNGAGNNAGDKNPDTPATGDMTSFLGHVALLITAAAAMVILQRKKIKA